MPHSVNYAYDADSSKKGKTFEVDHLWVDSLSKVNGKTLWIKPHFTPPSGTLPRNKVMTEPFWAVRKVEEQAGGGNMVLTTLSIRGSHTVTWNGVEPVAGTMQATVPVLTNPTDLKKGDELVWAIGSKKKRKSAPIKQALNDKKPKLEEEDHQV